MQGLLGNQAIRQRLGRLAATDRLHPCLLFEGPPGIGKAETARWLAQSANCTSPLGKPCGQCWSCRQIVQGTHPDVIVVGLDPERTAPIISVRQARALTASLRLRPYQARRRFVIIDPADAMGPGAANALLKTFEEPPDATGFVLVSESAARLLPTVRSRSQRVRFAPLSTEELATFLRSREVEASPLLLALAQGCPGRALTLVEGELAAWQQARDAFLAALDEPIEARLKFAEKLVKGDRAKWTARVGLMLDALSRLVVDALGHAAGAEAPRMHVDRPKLVSTWGDRLGPEGLRRVGLAIRRAEDDLAAYVNGRLVIDTLLASLMGELGRRP